MAGRGFLLSRMAQQKATKEIDDSPKSQELPNHKELSKFNGLCISPEQLPVPQESTEKQDEIAKLSVPIVCSPFLINGGQQPLRGRRVITIDVLIKSYK